MSDKLKNIRNLSPNILANINKLIVNRIGQTPEAFMLTRDIISYISPNKTYRFTKDCKFKAAKKSLQIFDPQKLLTPPDHAVLNGQWNNKENIFNPNANILGGMGELIVNENQSIKIPVITATKNNLSFYNARLLEIGDTLTFETKQDLPITETTIGQDYVDFYLSQEKAGGGEYIEYHEEPHLWSPKNDKCGGHILLGKQLNNKFYFTGFKIPYNHAIYLSPNTLHSDAYLIGDYIVVYTVTKKYSTVLFKDSLKKLKRLEFILNKEQ